MTAGTVNPTSAYFTEAVVVSVTVTGTSLTTSDVLWLQAGFCGTLGTGGSVPAAGVEVTPLTVTSSTSLRGTIPAATVAGLAQLSYVVCYVPAATAVSGTTGIQLPSVALNIKARAFSPARAPALSPVTACARIYHGLCMTSCAYAMLR